MGLEPKVVHFRGRQLPGPELPFLVPRLVDEVAEIDRDRNEIEWRLRGERSDQLGPFF